MLDPRHVQTLARRLHDARKAAKEIDRLTLEFPDLSVDDGYAVQAAGIALRLADGEKLVGLKMGLTSEAKRKQMSLDSPVYGELTAQMRAQGELPLGDGIHPKIEPEIAFRIARELRAPLTLEEAAAGCDGVAPAMEILDSRFRDFKYFSLPDVIADNSSSYRFTVGAFRPLAGLALDKLQMRMSVDGAVKQQATSDAISGNPLLSVVQLCDLLARQKRTLPAGSIVLAGAATVAEPLRPGMVVQLVVEGLGEVTLKAV